LKYRKYAEKGNVRLGKLILTGNCTGKEKNVYGNAISLLFFV
jgi:hypothetical protein